MDFNELNPESAYREALRVGNVDELRTIACGSPEWAYTYAEVLDKKAIDETRSAVAKNPSWAYWYARNIDKTYEIETLKAVVNSEYLKLYVDYFGLNNKVVKIIPESNVVYMDYNSCEGICNSTIKPKTDLDFIIEKKEYQMLELKKEIEHLKKSL